VSRERVLQAMPACATEPSKGMHAEERSMRPSAMLCVPRRTTTMALRARSTRTQWAGRRWPAWGKWKTTSVSATRIEDGSRLSSLTKRARVGW
jgi:hypothetical protein